MLGQLPGEGTCSAANFWELCPYIPAGVRPATAHNTWKVRSKMQTRPTMFESTEKDLEFIGTTKPAHVPARNYSVEGLCQR